MKSYLNPALALVMAAALAGCATPAGMSPASTGAALLAGAPTSRNVLLKGRAQFPQEAARKLQALEEEVGSRATVSLIETANGNVVAGGVTGVNGDFTLYQSDEPYQPTVGAVYTLEITKRLGANNAVLALRTALIYDPAGEIQGPPGTGDYLGWNSITGRDILVNLQTSAAMKIADKDAEIQPVDLINKVWNGELQGTIVHTYHAVGAPWWFRTGVADSVVYTGADLTAMTSDLRTKLLADMDPAANATGTVIDGDFHVTDPMTLEALAYVSRIEGDLVVDLASCRQNWPTSFQDTDLKISAPLLKEIGGDLRLVDGDEGGRKIRTYQLNAPGKNQNSRTLSRITSLQGLGALNKVGGSVVIGGLKGLKTLAGLEGLQEIGCSLTVGGCPDLTSLKGLENVQVVKKIAIVENDQLASAAALHGIRLLDGGLQISGNRDLTALPDLSSLQRLGGMLMIQGNRSLASVEGLLHLEKASSFQCMEVRDNELLTEAQLEALEEIFGGNAQTAQFSAGYEQGFADARSQYENSGYWNGYYEGQADGENTGYNNGQNAVVPGSPNYQAGYDAGYLQAQTDAANAGGGDQGGDNGGDQGGGDGGDQGGGDGDQGGDGGAGNGDDGGSDGGSSDGGNDDGGSDGGNDGGNDGGGIPGGYRVIGG